MINWNYELFREELARQSELIFWGQGYEGFDPTLNVSEVLKQHQGVNFILTHFEHRDNRLTPGLEDVKDIPRIHICGDYYEYKQSVIKSYNAHFRKINYDIIFIRDHLGYESLKRHNISGKHYVQLLYADVGIYKKLNIEKTIDVMASLRAHISAHPGREELGQRISKMDITHFFDIVWFHDYIEKINQARIFATSNIRNDFLTAKWFEVLACGTFMLTTKPNENDWMVSGFKDGIHLVLIKNDFSDLEDKINYFLKNEKEREEIALNGQKFVQQNHSTKIRVNQFLQTIIRS